MIDKIVAIVYEAGKIVRNARRIEQVTREKNGAADLVTEYDEGVQAFLKEKLTAMMPEADFFGEEGEHPVISKDWAFIADPIDGTTNFVRGLHFSNIAVALTYRGQVRYAAVYAPYTDEMFAAERGRGATLNGVPIHVSDRPPDHAIVLCGSTIYDRSYTDRSFALMRYLYDNALDIRRFGAAELDACQVAAGRAEIFFECRLSPWDFAASSLIVEEAGGHLTRLDGSPVDPWQGGSVWCTNDKCFEIYKKLPK